MRNLFVFLFAIVVFAGCDEHERGSGNVITEKRNIGSFSKINASNGIDVEVRKGNTTEIRVEADDNIIEFVETKVENGTLRIRISDNTNLNDTHVKVFVTASEISSIDASSSADVEVKDVLTYGSTISFEATSAASITSAVDAPGINASASSSGEIKISGRTKNFNANSSSAGSIKAFELLSENTTAEASSGGSVDAHASISVDANASSGGDIDYRGAATIVKKQESSGGSVNKEDN